MPVDLSEKAETVRRHRGGKRRNFSDCVQGRGIYFTRDWVNTFLEFAVCLIVRMGWHGVFGFRIWSDGGQAHCMAGMVIDFFSTLFHHFWTRGRKRRRRDADNEKDLLGWS